MGPLARCRMGAVGVRPRVFRTLPGARRLPRPRTTYTVLGHHHLRVKPFDLRVRPLDPRVEPSDLRREPSDLWVRPLPVRRSPGSDTADAAAGPAGFSSVPAG